MIRFKRVISVCGAALVLMTGCNGSGDLSDFSQNALAINRDGSVTELSVETFEEDYYSLEDLTAYVQDEVDTFNREHPPASGKEDETAITVDEVDISEGIARVVLTYESSEIFTEFNYGQLVSGSASDLPQEALALNCVDPEGTEAGTIASIENLEDYKAVMVSSDVLVTVPGKIAYVSDNVTVTDRSVADCDGTLAVIIYS